MFFWQMTRLPSRTLFVMGTAWLLLEFIVLGKYSVMWIGDNADILIPAFSASEIVKISDRWNPFSTNGMDRLVFGFFTPGYAWFFDLFPSWAVYQFVVVVKVLSGVAGTWLLARKTLKIGNAGSVFAALLYGVKLSGGGSFGDFDLGILPALIYAISVTLDHPRKIAAWGILIGLVAASSQFTYIARVTPFYAVVIIPWFIFVAPRRSIFDWTVIISILAFLPISRIDEYLAILTYAPLSSVAEGRLPITLGESIDGALYSIVDRFLLSRYCLLAVACFLCGLILGGQAQVYLRRTRLVLIGGIVFALCAPVFLVFIRAAALMVVPAGSALNLMIVTDYFFFLLAIAGGYGFQQIVSSGLRSLAVVAAGVWFLFSLDVKRIGINDWITQGNFVQNFQSPAIKAFADNVREPHDPSRVTGIQLYDSFLQTYGLETFGGFHAVHSRRLTDYWGLVNAPWRQATKGSSQLHPMRMFLTHRPAEHDAVLENNYSLPLLSLANVRYLISRDSLSSDNLKLLMFPEGAGWSELSVLDKIAESINANFRGRRILYFYENRDAFSRFFFVEGIRRFRSQDELLKELASASKSELQTRLFALEGDLPTGWNENVTLQRTPIKMEHYSGDRIVLSLELDGPGLLVASNTYSPFWTVFVDGYPGKIFPAYHTFWGLYLPQGARSIEFRYAPVTTRSLVNFPNSTSAPVN